MQGLVPCSAGWVQGGFGKGSPRQRGTSPNTAYLRAGMRTTLALSPFHRQGQLGWRMHRSSGARPPIAQFVIPAFLHSLNDGFVTQPPAR